MEIFFPIFLLLLLIREFDFNKMRLNPVTLKKLHRFKSIKRGYISLWILIILICFSFFLEIFINNKPLVIQYEEQFYFPLVQDYFTGKDFGLSYSYKPKYRELQEHFEKQQQGNYLIMPLIPYDPYENDFSIETPPPHPPSFKTRHLLGTDSSGRDVLARLLYGFRVAIFFSIALYLITSVVGVLLGSLMGYFGGFFDLIFQRLVEIWSTIPTLYIIIILAALVTPTPILLLIILAIMGWTGMTWLIRAEVYREKNRQYCEAARSMGASHLRIIIRHLLPNSLVPIVASFPFQMVGGIGALTSLDYLGYGLPIPTPSWGELLQQGQQSFDYAPWILLSPSVATIVVLMFFTFVGEAIRESFDPKTTSFYE